MVEPQSAQFPECPMCGGTGWRPAVEGAVKGPMVPCECQKEARLDRLIEASGIPVKYQTCDFNTFDCHWEGYKNESLYSALKYANTFVEEYYTGSTKHPGLLL